ncbi:MAG: hypothetical protein COW70_01040 [Hydrogenophilales bacterium CG18_big_fil_WC_8_21_14_2_50_58_12]|nr:MAG: hypothetical protein COW70_01040 [Hydrogenophilales bacterium CG18_big_fil_WC_8_21_14_2_50_58_12]
MITGFHARCGFDGIEVRAEQDDADQRGPILMRSLAQPHVRPLEDRQGATPGGDHHHFLAGQLDGLADDLGDFYGGDLLHAAGSCRQEVGAQYVRQPGFHPDPGQ